MQRWHWIRKDIYSPWFALTGYINGRGYPTGLFSSHSCIFMSVLVNTCFSRQPKRKERGTFRRCGVLKLYTCLLYVAPFLSHHRPMWSRVFLFPNFSVLLVDTDGSAYHRAFLHWMLKIQKNHAQLGFKPNLGAAENSTGLTV